MGKMTDEQRQTAFAAYAAGETVAALARQYGVTEQSLWKSLKRRGLLVQRLVMSPPLTEAEIDRAVSLYNSGQSVPDVATVMDRSAATIWRAFNTRGVLLTKAKSKLRRISDATRDQIVTFYQDGKTLDEIEKTLADQGVTRTVAKLELKRRGISRRRAGARGIFFNRPEKQQEIIKQYADGVSASQLAELNGCSIDPIFKILRDADVEIRDFDAATGLEWTDGSGRTRTMRSMWEIKAAKYLDAGGRKWDYESEHYDIGDGHVYTPDFWVYTSDGVLEKIVDVKGWLRPESAASIEKFKALYPTLPFELWNEAKLTELGILAISLKDEKIKLAPNHVAGRQPMPQSEKDIIAALYTSGLTVAETAAKSGRSHTTVEEILSERKLLRGKHKSRLLKVSQEVRDEIARLYTTGLSVTDVSEELKIGRDLVHGEVTRRGIARPKNGVKRPTTLAAVTKIAADGTSMSFRSRLPQEKWDEIIALYESGQSVKSIGLSMSLDSVLVYRGLKKLGVVRKTDHPRGAIDAALGSRIEDLYASGKSTIFVSEETGAAISSIRTYLRKQGLLRDSVEAGRNRWSKA